MPPHPGQPASPMQRLLARLDAAFGETVPNRALARLLDVGESSLRRWRKGDPLAEDVVVRTAAALGLEPGQVRGYDRMPEAWPPSPLLERLGREKRSPGRKPRLPATPAPGMAAPPAPAHQIVELRALILGLRDALMERLERIERALAPERTDGKAVKNGASYATGTAMPPIEPGA